MAKVSNAPESRASLRSDLDARDPFVSWQVVDLQFPETPDTDMVIPHNLQINHPRDVHYRVIKQFVGGTVYESAHPSAKQWTSDYIVLRSDTPFWTGRLLLGVLKKVVDFPAEDFDIPEEPPCPCEPDTGEPPDGEECQVVCATSGQLVAPPAADGVSITPSGSAWVSSDWVEIEAATPESWVITAVTYNTLDTARTTGNFFEIDLGIGPEGAESVVATITGLMGSDSATNADPCDIFEFPIPANIVPEGARLVARHRQASTDTAPWKVAVTYYPLPFNEGEEIPYADVGPTCWPLGATPATIVPNTTAWADSDWHELTASAGSDWFVGGLMVYTPICEFEIDLGVGAEGEEVVLTTLRGQTQFSFREGAGYHWMMLPVLDAIREGDRVVVRQRKSGTSATATSIKAIFYRQRVRSYTTGQPMQSWPSASASIAVTSPGDAYGDWVEFKDFTTEPTAITAICAERGSGSIAIQLGFGLPGQEEVVGTYHLGQGISTAGGWQRNIVLPIAKYVPIGTRVSLRKYVGSGGTGTRSFAIQYIANPDFNNISTDVASTIDVTNLSTPGSWTSSDWEVIMDPVPEDIRIWGMTPAFDFGEIEIDFGVGLAGEEQVITTVRYACGAGGSGAGARTTHFPVPHCIEAGQRFVARGRDDDGDDVDFVLYYMTNNGDVVGTCGPEDPDGEGGSGGSGSGSGGPTTPSLTTDNAIVRWDGVDGSAIQNSGITITDGTSGTLSGTNSGDVTLAGTPDYITISGQVITRNQIDLDTDVTGRLDTLTQLPTVATDRLLGRETAGTGDIEQIALSEYFALSATTLNLVKAWVPLGDGDVDNPNLLFADGHPIMVLVDIEDI